MADTVTLKVRSINGPRRLVVPSATLEDRLVWLFGDVYYDGDPDRHRLMDRQHPTIDRRIRAWYDTAIAKKP